jgi:phosphoribosyl-AMP cyclohydrolase
MAGQLSVRTHGRSRTGFQVCYGIPTLQRSEHCRVADVASHQPCLKETWRTAGAAGLVVGRRRCNDQSCQARKYVCDQLSVDVLLAFSQKVAAERTVRSRDSIPWQTTKNERARQWNKGRHSVVLRDLCRMNIPKCGTGAFALVALFRHERMCVP